MVNYIIMEPALDNGFTVHHYTEDHQLIAVAVWDEYGNCADILFDDAMINLGFWWGCTKEMYHVQKLQFEAENPSTALGDAVMDWITIPVNTLRLVASGLYCMGVN